jgi:hypothetical protein
MVREIEAASAARLKHLAFVQAVVELLASNSIFVKGWSITAFAALLSWAESRAPAGGFGLDRGHPVLGLDAYYLWLEPRLPRLVRPYPLDGLGNPTCINA